MAKNALPETSPLESAPLRAVNLNAPPEIRWFSVARHGRFPVEDYRLPGLCCLHLYRYVGAVRTQGVTLPIRPGYAGFGILDTSFSHFFPADGTPCIHLTAGFRLPPLTDPARAAYLPAMLDLGDRFGPLNAALEQAVLWQETQPRRAAARLWDILWQLSDETRRGNESSDYVVHPALARTQERIELGMSGPLRVAELAAAVDLSHNHLTRLFQEAFGVGPLAYIRARRVAQAQNLLQNTDLPIKTIAAQVGLPDLHQFNKVLRTETGLSPRALRKRVIGPQALTPNPLNPPGRRTRPE